MPRSVRFTLFAVAAASLAACSSSPLGPAKDVCRRGDSCSTQDFVNPNADFVNPNADFVNPNASVISAIDQ
jgi:hypothetical protein